MDMDYRNDAFPHFSFVAISDLHITPKLRGNTAAKRRAAWRWILNNEASFCLIAGDITNGSAEEEFSIAQAGLTSVVKKTPVLVAYGNHDYIPNNQGAAPSPESRKAFSDWIRQNAAKHGVIYQQSDEALYYACKVCGVQILCLDCAINYPSAAAGEEQLKWLDERLSESDGDRFRIVMSHFPLNSYIPGLAGRRKKSFVRDSLKQQKILEKHKNILFISGHTHYSLDSDSPSVLFDSENRIAYMNTASVGNVIPNQKEVRNGEAENASGSMGLYVMVFESTIQIKGIDFCKGNPIPRCNFTLNL